MDRFNAGTVDLADVCRVDQHERDERPEEGLFRDPFNLQRRNAEAEHVNDEDARHAAEEVHVDRGEDAQRCECWGCNGAPECDQQTDREDEEFGDDEEANVDGERLRNGGERGGEVASVEEGLLDLGPGGG